MLNIGKLSPGGGQYYIGEIATSAEDYYTGHGEASGRWVGTLAADMGLVGEVDPEHFRRVLLGQDPHTAEALIASRAPRTQPSMAELGLKPGTTFDVAQVANVLGVSARYVRFLLHQGEEHQTRLRDAGPDEMVREPSASLHGRLDAGKGTGRWVVPAEDVARYLGEHKDPKYRPGFDLTLRPPKGVSVLWALSDDNRRAVIRKAHSEAVDEVVRYYENNVIRVRSSQRHRGLLDTDGVIAAAFDHRTSRAGDPLLHTHVVVANMTRIVGGDEDGAWRALFSPALFEHAKAGGHLYQAHLRRRLTEWLGVEFGPVLHGYAEVEAIPARVIDTFSKRRNEIEEVLAETGNTSARAAQVATLDTRRNKEYGVDAETLVARWRSEAEADGFGAEQVERCFARTSVEHLSAAQIDGLHSQLGGSIGLTERASTFVRTDVIEAVASAIGSSCTATGVERLADGFLASVHVVPVVDVQVSTDAMFRSEHARIHKGSSTQYLYTTRELALLEDELLRWADSECDASPIDEPVVARMVAARPELSDEQADMVDAACRPNRAVMPIAGRPGAGKTYATEAIVAAHVEAGVAILGCAVSATAAAELERAAGFDRSIQPATTLAGLLVELDRTSGSLPVGVRIVVDEASMVATRDLHRLLGYARAANGVVLLIGDPDQHGSVDVGGVFQRLCRDRGENLVQLVDNNRQLEPSDRLAIEEYREGHIAEALARYDDAGQIIRSRTAGESLDAMVADWYADWLTGSADPMIAGPNTMRRALNDRARSMLKAEGHLRGETLVVAGREFMVGDEVVARRNDRRIRNPATNDFVKNGSVGVVTRLDRKHKRMTVAFEQEGTITVPTGYLAAGRVEHAYARTTYGVQGTTQDTTRYHPTDGSGFEEGYVALTRGRRTTKVYVVAGTVEEEDELSHLPAEGVSVGVGDVADSLSRRRANAMAADRSPRLADIVRVADAIGSIDLDTEIAMLRARLADRPRDHRPLITELATSLDTLTVRQRAGALAARRPDANDDTPAQLRRGALDEKLAKARMNIEQRLRTLTKSQRAFDTWETDHAPELDRLAVLSAAKQAIVHQQGAARTIGERSMSNGVDLGP